MTIYKIFTLNGTCIGIFDTLIEAHEKAEILKLRSLKEYNQKLNLVVV